VIRTVMDALQESKILFLMFDLNSGRLSLLHFDVDTKYANLYVDILFFKSEQHLVKDIVGVPETRLSELLLESGQHSDSNVECG